MVRQEGSEVSDDELTRLRQENHRLADLVRAADLVHIRLRDGLRRALDGWVSEIDAEYGETAKERRPATLAELEELRKLLPP